LVGRAPRRRGGRLLDISALGEGEYRDRRLVTVDDPIGGHAEPGVDLPLEQLVDAEAARRQHLHREHGYAFV
jgi:hypothetical protein